MNNDLLNNSQERLFQALENAQNLSSCAARRCEEARTLLDEPSDKQPHEAARGLKEAHKHAVQVIWQLRSIASELDETLMEVEDIAE